MLSKINISQKKNILIVYIVLAVVTLAVFWQVNHYDFVNLDDNIYVTKNSHVQSGITLEGFRWAFSTTYAQYWHPLAWLSLMFDYQLYGLNAGGYHLTNLILHILSTLLLFWLFNRMTGSIWKSAFVAALFALHPLRVESVAWVAKRRDVLCVFWGMLTLCLYAYYTEKPVIKRYLLVLFSFMCALMSKPMVITLPVIMILLDYWPLRRLQSQRFDISLTNFIPIFTNQEKQESKPEKEVLKENIFPSNDRKLSEPKIVGIIPLWQLKEKTPFFVLSAVFSIIALYARNDPYMIHYSLGSRIANALVSFITYLEKIFWPRDLSVLYLFSAQIPIWQILSSALLIVVISAAVVMVVKRLPYLFVGWLWYAITILPVLGIIQYGNLALSDHHTYLPFIGIAIMLAWGIPSLINNEEIRKIMLFSATAFVLIIMSVLTWKQCGYWKNSFELFNHAVLVTKNNFLAIHSRGYAYSELGQYKLAIEDYNETIRLKQNYGDAYHNRGNVYANIGQYQLAIEDYNKAIRLKPNYVEAYYNRGIAYVKISQYQLAIEDFNEAIRLNPALAYIYNNRGIAYGKLGQHQLAIEDFNEAIHLNPNEVSPYNSRGNVYANIGQYQLALEDFNEATRLKPEDVLAHYNRGTVYAELGQYQLAIEDFNATIRLQPDYALAYNNRGFVYAELGQYQRAIEDFNKAIRLKSDYTESYYNRGNAYAKFGQYQRAIEDFNKAIRLKPNYIKAYNKRGTIYLRQGNNKCGCCDARKACALGNCRVLEYAKIKGFCR